MAISCSGAPWPIVGTECDGKQTVSGLRLFALENAFGTKQRRLASFPARRGCTNREAYLLSFSPFWTSFWNQLPALVAERLERLWTFREPISTVHPWSLISDYLGVLVCNVQRENGRVCSILGWHLQVLETVCQRDLVVCRQYQKESEAVYS